MERVTYRIDAHDAIVSVGDDWAAFARSNGAPQLADGTVGCSLWHFVSGEMTRLVYRELLARVRRGRPAEFAYRCDAPALRRFMWMTMRSAGQGAVDFDSVTLRTEVRVPPVPGVTPELAIAPSVRMCSWCKQVAVAASWQELDLAVERLGLFDATAAQSVTHTLCPPCLARFTADMDISEARDAARKTCTVT